MSEQTQHFEIVRDVKKNVADIEFALHTSSDINTVRKIEDLLKKTARDAQTKREKMQTEKTT